MRWRSLRGGTAKSALPVLIDVLEKGDSQDRRYAASALGQWGPEAKDAVPALIRGLERSTDVGEKAVIAAALGGMDAAAKDALPSIYKARDEIPRDKFTVQEYMSIIREFDGPANKIRSALTLGERTPYRVRPSGPAAKQRDESPKGVAPSVPKPDAKEPKPAKTEAPKSK